MKQKLQASALIYVLILLGIMIAIAVVISMVSVTERKGSTVTADSVQAFANADSGLEKFMALYRGPVKVNDTIKKIFSGNDKFDCDSGKLVTTLNNDSEKQIAITLYGDEWRVLSCESDFVRDITSVKVEGKYNGTLRVLQSTIKTPCPKGIKHDSFDYDSIRAKDGRCWLDRNLGAGQVAQNKDDASAFGDYYQWGRATDGHEKPSSRTTRGPVASTSPGLEFVQMNSDKNWLMTEKPDLWDKLAQNNPCPKDFHVPTYDEWEAVMDVEGIANAKTAFDSSLKLPMAGYRGYDSEPGHYGNYWTSTYDQQKESAYRFFFNDNKAELLSDLYQANGLRIRCIMN